MDTCPDCDGPLVRKGTFCRECGWDADLPDDDYLDGVDVPEAVDYDAVLAREGLATRDRDAPASGRQTVVWAVILLAAAAALVAWKLGS